MQNAGRGGGYSGEMDALVVDRARPPSRLVYRDETRVLELRPWSFADVDRLLAAIGESLAELRAFMPWAHQALTREGYYQVVSRFQAEYHAGRDYTFGMFS